MAPITINGIVFDPVAEAPVLNALNLEAKDASNSNYILVGFKILSSKVLDWFSMATLRRTPSSSALNPTT
jgi:hypothetical protein